MSRKDYVRIAAAIKATEPETVEPGPHQAARNDIAFALADALKDDNPRFDRHRFLVACGIVA